MNIFSTISESLSHLFFPHICLSCSTDILNTKDKLCAKCFSELPTTDFFKTANNPIEKTFYGRMKIENAGAGFYFTKESLLQHLLIQLKYKGNKDLGIYLGKLLGYQILASKRFNEIDALVALPLNSKKEFKRGYNQALKICEGVSEIINKPIIEHAVTRTIFTETQTHENRINRWQNMDGVFSVTNTNKIDGKHILLIDDVITTGATLEACGSEILKTKNTKLSIATVAYTI